MLFGIVIVGAQNYNSALNGFLQVYAQEKLSTQLERSMVKQLLTFYVTTKTITIQNNFKALWCLKILEKKLNKKIQACIINLF